MQAIFVLEGKYVNVIGEEGGGKGKGKGFVARVLECCVNMSRMKS